MIDMLSQTAASVSSIVGPDGECSTGQSWVFSKPGPLHLHWDICRAPLENGPPVYGHDRNTQTNIMDINDMQFLYPPLFFNYYQICLHSPGHYSN